MSSVPFVEMVGDVLQFSFPYSQSSVAAVHFRLPGAKWDHAKKHWKVRYDQLAVDSLKKIFPKLSFGESLRRELGAKAESQYDAEEKKFLPLLRDVEITDFEFKTVPMLHQKVTFDFARSLDQAALFLEQGLGKTKIAIDVATWRYRDNQVRRVLYVCPNSVAPNWEQEDVKQHLHGDFDDVSVLHGSTINRKKQLQGIADRNLPGWVITSFDSLRNLEDILVKMQGRGSEFFQMMVLDESSKIKHYSSQRSKSAWRIGKTVKYRNILTGTPITQTGEDVFAQLRFLNDKIFGPFATQFRANYLIMGGFENRAVIGYKNFSDFLKKVYSVSIRFTKDQCLDLPPKIYERRYARLDDEVSGQYRQLERECVAEFCGAQITAALALSKLVKLSQVTGGFVYEQGEDRKRVATHVFKKNPKLEVLEEVLDEVLPKKVIVWCRFTQEIKTIQGMLKSKGISHVTIHGAVKPSNAKGKKTCTCGECRGCHVAKFQFDPSCQVFLGQVDTAGLGITLTAASYVVYYSNNYSLESRLQSEDRCHRIGQKNSVTYIDVVAELAGGKKTIDHDVLDVVRGKSAFAEQVSMALIRSMMDRVDPKAEIPEKLKVELAEVDVDFIEDEAFE